MEKSTITTTAIEEIKSEEIKTEEIKTEEIKSDEVKSDEKENTLRLASLNAEEDAKRIAREKALKERERFAEYYASLSTWDKLKLEFDSYGDNEQTKATLKKYNAEKKADFYAERAKMENPVYEFIFRPFYQNCKIVTDKEGYKFIDFVYKTADIAEFLLKQEKELNLSERAHYITRRIENIYIALVMRESAAISNCRELTLEHVANTINRSAKNDTTLNELVEISNNKLWTMFQDTVRILLPELDKPFTLRGIDKKFITSAMSSYREKKQSTANFISYTLFKKMFLDVIKTNIKGYSYDSNYKMIKK